MDLSETIRNWRFIPKDLFSRFVGVAYPSVKPATRPRTKTCQNKSMVHYFHMGHIGLVNPHMYSKPKITYIRNKGSIMNKSQ